MIERDFLEDEVVLLIDRFIAEAKRRRMTLNELAILTTRLDF
jgi:hypothetical protein